MRKNSLASDISFEKENQLNTGFIAESRKQTDTTPIRSHFDDESLFCISRISFDGSCRGDMLHCSSFDPQISGMPEWSKGTFFFEKNSQEYDQNSFVKAQSRKTGEESDQEVCKINKAIKKNSKKRNKKGKSFISSVLTTRQRVSFKNKTFLSQNINLKMDFEENNPEQSDILSIQDESQSQNTKKPTSNFGKFISF